MQDSILNITISVFKDYNTPDAPQPLNLLHWLTSEKYADRVNTIRAEKCKAVRDSLKATLPAITPHGLFTYRSARCLIQHSGFIQFDIDFKENSHITNYKDLKAEICKIVNVAYCGLSVSGTGYWGLIPIAHKDKHQQYFDFIYNAFKNIGISIDKKPRNLAALRGYSYDADAYFNHFAKPLEHCHQPENKPRTNTLYSNSGNSTQNHVETLINDLIRKGIDLTGTYDDWLNIGFAFAHEFAEVGRQYFHNVSSIYAGYNPSETDEQYTKCLKAGASCKPITIKSFFGMCKDAGIELPKKEKKQEANIERFKIKNSQDYLVNQLFLNDIISMTGETHTGKDFNKIIIAGIKTKSGKVYDLLFDESGELIKPGEQSEAVKNLANFFQKNLQPAMFNASPCWVHSDK